MNKPKISVIVPVFNVEKYLARCLESIISQSYENLEIICVDYGSTDSCSKILDEYALKDARIKIITQKNGGLSAARNAGLEAASGKYIAFVDSDDWIESETYAKAVEPLEKDEKIGFVSFGANVVADVGMDENAPEIVGMAKYHKLRLNGLQKMSVKVMLDTTVTAWNKLYRKSIIDAGALRFPKNLLHEDHAFSYCYALNCEYGYYLDEYFYNYIQRADSIMGRQRKSETSRPCDRLKVFEVSYDYFKAHGKLFEYKSFFVNLLYEFLCADYAFCHPDNRNAVLSYATKIAQKMDSGVFGEFDFVQHLRRGEYRKIIKLMPLSLPQKILKVFFYKRGSVDGSSLRIIIFGLPVYKKVIKDSFAREYIFGVKFRETKCEA